MNLLAVHESAHAISAHNLLGASLAFIQRDPAGGFFVTNNIAHKRIGKRELVGMMLAGILGEQILSWALQKRTQKLHSKNVGSLMWNLFISVGPASFMKTAHGESDAKQINQWLAEGFITEDALGESINFIAPQLLEKFRGIDFPAMNRELNNLEGKDYIELDFSEALVTWEPVTFYDPACAVA